MSVTTFSVDAPFPLPHPTQESAVLEMTEEGDLIAILQFPGVTKPERQMFKKGIRRYYITDVVIENVPIVEFIMEFDPPIGFVKMNFDAKKMQNIRPTGIASFLSSQANSLLVYLLDGHILKGIKLLGLHIEAIQHFKTLIKKQMSCFYNDKQFDEALNALYSKFNSEQIAKTGTKYLLK